MGVPNAWCLDASMPSSGTRPPVGQQREQVEDADRAVAVEVRRAAGVGDLTPNELAK